MERDVIGFDLFGAPVYEGDLDEPAEAPEGLSAGRKLTLRLRELSDQGINPLTGEGDGPKGRTCGDCKHRISVLWHDRTYPKCELGPATHGPQTDVRAYWPACTRF